MNQVNNIDKQIAPIALFVYNRREHTKKTVEALQKNNLAKESELFIFSDGWKDEQSKEEVEKVRNYIKTISGFKKVEIIERSKNVGLADSIISGVTEIVNRYEKVIVLEDDLVTSPYFLEYMNEALNLYEKEEKIGSVHGYLYPVTRKMPDTFLVRHISSWGWGTWKRAWDLFEPNGKKLLQELKDKKLIKKFNFGYTYDFSGMLKRQIEGKNNSWAIRWYASLFLEKKLSLYPSKSLIQNIGQDGSGTNMGSSGRYNVPLPSKKPQVKLIPIEESFDGLKAFSIFFRGLQPSFAQRVIKKMKNIIMGKCK